MTKRSIEADGVGRAWQEALAAMLETPELNATHFVVRISNPLPEETSVRVAADELLGALELQPVETVRNTIFPYEWANDVPELSSLADEYVERYSDLRKLAGSPRGTYFGRMVAYPRADGSISNQLLHTVEKIRRSVNEGPRRTSTYEINIYSELKDSGAPLGFPCMSHAAFHLEHDMLHLAAVYRNQDLVRRGYGNYLGLAQLQQYVADITSCTPGELLVLAGHTYIEDGAHARRAAATLSTL